MPTALPKTNLEEGLELLANTLFVGARRAEPVRPRPTGVAYASRSIV